MCINLCANSLCIWLEFACKFAVCDVVNCRKVSFYVAYAHSQSQAVILQVLSVGGGVVGESGVGDELRITTTTSMSSFSNLNKAIALTNFQCHLVMFFVLSPV